jgi:hypothetical protein
MSDSAGKYKVVVIQRNGAHYIRAVYDTLEEAEARQVELRKRIPYVSKIIVEYDENYVPHVPPKRRALR